MQADELADPEAAAIHRLQHGMVAHPFGLAVVYSGEQEVYLRKT